MWKIRRILALCLCLVLLAGTACAEEIHKLGGGYWGYLNHGCTLPDGRLVFLISFLPACAPTAATVTQLAQIYGQDSVYASAINILTTLLCILTMPFFVWLYELF